jgi:lipopolysaccharide transport system ATP-binding protein
MLLRQGRLALLGDIDECVRAYESTMASLHGSAWTRPPTLSSGPLSYKSLALELEGDQPNLSLRVDFVLESRGMHKPAFVAFDITDAAGVTLMQALPVLEGFVHPKMGCQSFTVVVDLPPLIPGQYWVTPWVGSHNTESFDQVNQCASFEVNHSPTQGRSFPHTADHGYIVPPSHLEVRSSRTARMELEA